MWDWFDCVIEVYCGECIWIMVGFGMMEVLLLCLFMMGLLMCVGYIGLFVFGCDVKFVLCGGKYELCFKGLNVMCGYWYVDVDLCDVFDEEGYYCSGDVGVFVDLVWLEFGLLFDGWLIEDFKLSSGMFVSVGLLCVNVVLMGVLYV